MGRTQNLVFDVVTFLIYKNSNMYSSINPQFLGFSGIANHGFYFIQVNRLGRDHHRDYFVDQRCITSCILTLKRLIRHHKPPKHSKNE